MEYVQESVTTLHDLTDPVPDVPVGRAAVVVPLTGAERATPAAEGVFRTLADVGPGRVVVPLRASPADARAVHEWLAGYDLPLEMVWCDGPALTDRLAAAGVADDPGKGRDVWLGLGVASTDHHLVAVHDADATSYSPAVLSRLLFPLTKEYRFSKGYYARVEDGRLYGRLFRLFLAPLLAALGEANGAPVLEYLSAFRYGLAGEFAATVDVVEQLRPPRGWGLEVATLGDAFRTAGVAGSAQVDLGVHQHDHRPVGGQGGLSSMAGEVAGALFAVLEDHGVTPEYETLPDRYRDAADRHIRQYRADAAFNTLSYDAETERAQVEEYVAALTPTGDPRLPAWRACPLDPADVREATRRDLQDLEG